MLIRWGAKLKDQQQAIAGMSFKDLRDACQKDFIPANKKRVELEPEYLKRCALKPGFVSEVFEETGCDKALGDCQMIASARTHTRTHTLARTHARTHTCTCMHTRTHAHTHVWARTCTSN